MTRLAADTTADDRRALGLELADRVIGAARGAGLEVIIVTADAAVRGWASGASVRVVAEPPSGGLDHAAATGVASASSGPWIVVHSDLPAITPDDLVVAAEHAERGIVLAPSHDGGTPLVGAAGGSFPFRYGPGSYRRHLAAVRGRASILIRPGLALDLDRPWDLDALVGLGHLRPPNNKPG